MKLVWLPRAIADLTDIRAYIADHDPGAARPAATRIRTVVGHLKAHPSLGRPSNVEGLREISVPGLPYVIPYRVKNERIELLRVFHTARQRPENWRDE